MSLDQELGRDDHDPYWEAREASKSIHPLYTSNIYVQPIGGGMVRVNLGASVDEELSYHTAVVMTAENAREFAKLIYQIGVAIAPEPIGAKDVGNVGG